eukprot:CAMPEP_0119339466 /NCGR_PEP_ID=MMETSP1333-20130426/98316_1 /TAXON_ID=418940 /ORGANISM="Scyphosphaera apsteinii, Strain RCC1455" /LENGTH=40 /DNA_ID= /DNA_START= /DNA_END= /DNA_ORIENTATION=
MAAHSRSSQLFAGENIAGIRPKEEEEDDDDVDDDDDDVGS